MFTLTLLSLRLSRREGQVEKYTVKMYKFRTFVENTRLDLSVRIGKKVYLPYCYTRW